MVAVTPVAADVGAVGTLTNAAIIVSTGKGGEAITGGQWIYQLAADNEFYKASATAGVTEATVKGVAIQPSSDGKGISYLGTNGTIVDLGTTLTEDTWYVISSTAGVIEPVADSSSGDYRSWVGYGNPDGNLVMYIINTGLQKT